MELQFIEWSLFGLRSARHVFRHPDQDVSVTLFPMIHIGDAEFFQTVYEDAAAHDLIITEGVRSSTVRRLTRAYRWIHPQRLGLVRQPKFEFPQAKTLHGDLSGQEFDALWRDASWLMRVAYQTAAGVFGLWLRFTATRESLGRTLNTTDVRDREEILAWNENTAPMHSALLRARDERLVLTLQSLLEQESCSRSIAVIYGAAHMPALTGYLNGRGYRPIESAWMTVFEA